MRYYLHILVAIFFILLGLSLVYQNINVVEVIPILGVYLLLMFTYKKFQFLNTSYTLMSLWLFGYIIGGHYTFANDILNYTQGLEYYKTHQYKKAYPIISQEAKRGNKEAQYLLANLYENGYGIEKDLSKSIFWYKKASSTYAYIVKTKDFHSIQTNKDNILKNKVYEEQKGLQFIFSKMDLTSPNVKDEVGKVVNKDFGILPYHSNYILPISYNKNSYTKRYSDIQSSNEKYDSNSEVEFQLSLQKNLSYDLFGFNEYISVGYTQHVWWQMYTDSAPFRETNYTPELFVTIPTSYDTDKLNNLKAIKFGYRHQSNGQDGYRSRSWDRLFLAGFWQWDNLFLKAEGWYRIPEDSKGADFYNGTNINDKGDDNPDIEDYLGYGEIDIKYLYGKHQLGLMLRNNLKSDNKGAIQFDWSVPMRNAKNTYWYVKAFNGYGESLIDYNQNNTKISFGFSFFRSLF